MLEIEGRGARSEQAICSEHSQLPSMGATRSLLPVDPRAETGGVSVAEEIQSGLELRKSESILGQWLARRFAHITCTVTDLGLWAGLK